MAGKAQYKLEDRGLKLLIREVPARRRQVLMKLAFNVQAHFMTNMSSSSPSSPGSPPAVVTGNLKNSSSVGMRDENTAEFRVGAEYILPLEFGSATVAPRPSVVPAVEAVAKTVPDEFKALVV